MEALSVRRLLAVAVLYVEGCPPLPWGTRCAGRAVGGGELGNWCENCTVWELLPLDAPFPLVVGAGATAECMVVRVVVKDRMDGAGEEKVLSTPRPLLMPPPSVLAPSPDDAVCDGATSECATSVLTVAAVDWLPVGGRSFECLLWRNEEVLKLFPVGTVEKDWWPFTGAAELPLMRPDSG